MQTQERSRRGESRYARKDELNERLGANGLELVFHLTHGVVVKVVVLTFCHSETTLIIFFAFKSELLCSPHIPYNTRTIIMADPSGAPLQPGPDDLSTAILRPKKS